MGDSLLNDNTDKETIVLYRELTVAAQPLGQVADALGTEAMACFICNRKTVCKDGLFCDGVFD